MRDLRTKGPQEQRSLQSLLAALACSESGPIFATRREWFCGVVREKVPWADFTKSFEQEVAWLALYFRVTWRSVRRIIQRVVARAAG